MPRPPAARAKVLTAFATLIVEQGERAATLDAVAERAGVSKGGLLYHFATKDALVEGLQGHLDELTAVDVELMRADPAGATDYLLRTSTVVDTEFELVYLALVRLAQGAYPRARAAIDRANDAWTAEIVAELRDPAVARAVVLLSDGLYSHASLRATGERTGHDVDELLGLVRELLEARRAR